MTPKTSIVHTVLAAILAATLLHVIDIPVVRAHIPRFPVVEMVESGAIKSWSSGETLTSADLNANFAHIHSLMVGGHGGRLVNADINASAAIASSKLASGSGIAKSFVFIADACGASPCTMLSPFNVTSVTRSSAGVYVVTLPYTVGGSAIQVTAVDATAPPNNAHCTANYLAGSTVTVTCTDAAAGTVIDCGFALTAHNTN